MMGQNNEAAGGHPTGGAEHENPVGRPRTISDHVRPNMVGTKTIIMRSAVAANNLKSSRMPFKLRNSLCSLMGCRTRTRTLT